MHHSLHWSWETQDLVFGGHITPRGASSASVGAHGWWPAAPGSNAATCLLGRISQNYRRSCAKLASAGLKAAEKYNQSAIASL